MLTYYEHQSFSFFGFSSRNWQWQADRPPGWSSHLHQHVEMVYLEEGTADVTIENETFHLQPGDLAVIFPHCSHSYTITVKKGEPHCLRGLCFAPHLAGEWAESLVTHLPRHVIVRKEQMTEDLLYPFQKLRYVLWEDEGCVKAYLHLLLFFLWPLLEVYLDNRDRRDNAPHRAIRYVTEHAHLPLRAQEVADALGISGSHLARIFSGHLNMSFNEYVNRLRVRMAEDRLRDSDKSVTDIMNEVGFESQSTFNRAFRKIHGISPREYRQLARPHNPETPGGDSI